MKEIPVKNITEEERDRRIEELQSQGHEEETIRMTIEVEDIGKEFFEGGLRVGNPERVKEFPRNLARALLEVQGYKPNF